MITVGVTWGDLVYMELVCDCKVCASRKYKRKIIITGDTFYECSHFASKSGWLMLRSDKKCYHPHHYKYARKVPSY